MAHSHASSLFAVVASSLLGCALLIACAGSGVKTPTKAGSDGGSAEGGGGAGSLATSPPPSGLPPMASMPPPGVAGSKKAKKKSDAALAACGGSMKASAKDPADLVKKIGDACAGPSKMKTVGSLLRGQQGDKEAHQENKFRAEANHCYRLYFATEEAVKDVVVVMRDSAGDVVAEAPGPAVPEDGAACFTTSDEVTLLVGVGSGKGAWAAQVWSD
jgi:hypothetical protein